MDPNLAQMDTDQQALRLWFPHRYAGAQDFVGMSW